METHSSTGAESMIVKKSVFFGQKKDVFFCHSLFCMIIPININWNIDQRKPCRWLGNIPGTNYTVLLWQNCRKLYKTRIIYTRIVQKYFVYIYMFNLHLRSSISQGITTMSYLYYLQ